MAVIARKTDVSVQEDADEMVVLEVLPEDFEVGVVIDVDEVSIDMGPTTVTKEVLVAPDGGFGWAVAAACFVISFLSAGYTRTFLAAVLKEFSSSGIGDSAWIKAGPTTLPLLLAPLSSMFLERFGHRATVALGYFLCALAMSLGSFAASIGPVTSLLSVFLGLGLALANTTALDCLKKHFTSKRPLAMCINKVGIILGGLASENWVEVLIGAVGFRGTWLVWSGMFVAILFLGLRVFGNPEHHFISETKEVPVEDTPQVEDDKVVESADIFVRFWRLLMGKMGFGFLVNVRFVLFVTICITMGFGNSCFTTAAARRANAIDLGTNDAGWISIIAIFGELAGIMVYGLAARRSPFPHFAEYSTALFVAAVCAGVPHLCGAFWLLVIFSILGGVANGVLKVAPVLVLIENHGVGNLVGTLNVLKMFDGITKLLYPFVASLMSTGTVAYFNGGAVGFSAVLGLSFSSVCFYLKK